MKTKSILLGAAIATAGTFTAHAQSVSGLAKADNVQGVETYVLSKPLRAYETVFTVRTGAQPVSLLTFGILNEGIAEKVSKMARKAVRKGLRKAQRTENEVDAIVYTGGRRAYAVRFTEDATAATKGIAQVDRIGGTEVYIMSQPVTDYQVVHIKDGGIKWQSYLTRGLFTYSIQQDVNGFVRRLKRKSQRQDLPVDAVVYSGGKSAIGVEFIQ